MNGGRGREGKPARRIVAAAVLVAGGVLGAGAAVVRAQGAPVQPPSSFAFEGLWREGRGERRTVEGHLVALTCWVKHAGFGPEHRNCARACAEAGLPVGFVDAKGRVYMVSGRGHGALAEANKPLLPHMETTVLLTGDFFEDADPALVEVVKVAKAARQPTPAELERRRRAAPR